MKLDKQKFFYISSDTFCVDISVFINYSMKDALKIKGKQNKALRELLLEYSKNDNLSDFENDEIKGRMLCLKRGYAIFLKFYKNSFRMNISLASHEISHLVSFILMDRRINLTKDSDEVYAYLTEHLTKQFLFKLY